MKNSIIMRIFSKKNIRLYLPVAVITLVIAVTLATCSSPKKPDVVVEESETPTVEETPTPSETPSEEPEETPSEEPEEPPYNGPYNPLSGLPCSEDISKNRPYAIMINNLRIAQPQLGMSQADIIYEVPVEGGITRMMALFQDVTNVGTIGSIRSSRPYFVDIAQGYDAIYIHAGGSPQAYEILASRNITRLDGVNGSKTDIFYRDSARRQKMGYEHSMVTTGERISKYLPTYNFRLEHKDGFESVLKFTDDLVPESWPTAQKFDIVYSSSKKTSFAFDSSDGVYGLSQYGTYYTDGNSGQQITAVNILVLKAPVSQIANDTEGRLKIGLTGSGSGYFIRGGKYTEIEWSKSSESAQFTYKFKDGSELLMGRGRTYICILPREVTVSFN